MYKYIKNMNIKLELNKKIKKGKNVYIRLKKE